MTSEPPEPEGPEPEDDTALAGEYVLGLLEPEARRAFELRLGGEPALRASVADWSERLVVLTEDIAPVQPPPQLRARIEAELFPAPVKPAPRGFSLMRLLSGGAAGLVAALALLLVLPFFLSPPPPPGPTYVAEIETEGARLKVVAHLDPATGELKVRRLAGAPGAGRSLELWLIAAGGAGPVSLGTVDPAETVIRIPLRGASDFIGGRLAISDEPLGGSRSGSPTNVLASAAVTLL